MDGDFNPRMRPSSLVSGWMPWLGEGASQYDTGWRCWPVADWGPVTIGTQTGIVGQYQWLWRRIGNLQWFAARAKRDTALTVSSGSGSTTLPNPPFLEFGWPTGYDPNLQLRRPGGATGNIVLTAIALDGATIMSVTALFGATSGYVVGTWCRAQSVAYITDDPWPDTLPGEAWVP